jgi:hypothetical protein
MAAGIRRRVRVELLSALLAPSCALPSSSRSIGPAPSRRAAAGAFGVSSVLVVHHSRGLHAERAACFATSPAAAAPFPTATRRSSPARLRGTRLANHWLCALSWPGAVLLWPMRRRVVRRSPWLLAALLAPPLSLRVDGLALSRKAWSPSRPDRQPAPAARYVLRRIYSEQDLARGPDLAQVAQSAGLRTGGPAPVRAVGAALAGLGFVWQWRRLPREVALALLDLLRTLAVLIATQEFRDDSFLQHRARLPAGGVGVLALWLGLLTRGAARVRGSAARAADGARGGVMGVALARTTGAQTAGRCATRAPSSRRCCRMPGSSTATTQTADRSTSRGALGLRPDVDVYNDMGLVFPNRIVDSEMPAEERDRRLAEFVRGAGRPVFAIYDWKLPGLPARPYGLFYEVTPGIVERRAVTLSAQAALEELVFTDPGAHPWNRFHRDRLVAAFAHWVAVRLERTSEPVEREVAGIARGLSQRFTGQPR